MLIGDLNKHIGNDVYGVRDNHNKITFGGELVRSLLYDGDYICVNNSPITTGGPFTRFDPSCPERAKSMSCIDLVIASKELIQFIEKVEIDHERKFSPIRPISKTKSVSLDHFPIIVTFSSMFCTKKRLKNPYSFTLWNTNKIGGWNTFKEMTDGDIFKRVNETSQNPSSTEALVKLNTIMTTIKYSAFGKVKRKKGKSSIKYNLDNSEDNNIKLLEQQRKEVEEEFKKVEKMKQSKGKTAAIFSTLNKIRGGKKAGSDLVAMKHPETSELIFNPKELKSASLDYCVNLLQNTEVDEDY